MKQIAEGINQENIKKRNRSAILKLISDNGELSRKDISEKIGLTPAAVTLICSELIDEGILVETGEIMQEKRAGRKKRPVSINYDHKKVLCICIEIDETYVSIAGMDGDLQAQKVLETNQSIEPEQFLKEVVDACKDLMWDAGVSKTEILAAGVSVPGTVDRAGGISLEAFRVWSKQVNVGTILSEQLGVRVIVENNVNAYAEGELIYGIGKTAGNLVFIKWGPGVGSSISINGELYRGRKFRGVEVGHVLVNDGEQTFKLETAVSTHAILEATKKANEGGKTPMVQEWCTKEKKSLRVQNIGEWGKIQDIELQKIFQEKVNLLSRITINMIRVFNPDNVVFYGKIFDVEGVSERFLAACHSFDSELEDGYILRSKLNEKISYIGPLSIVMNTCFF